MLEALALVNALVEPELVRVPGLTPKVMDFAKEARGIARESIEMMIHNNPIYLVHENGDDFACAVSKPSYWKWILAPDWALAQQTLYTAMCSLRSNWYIKNPVNNELALEGSGEDFDTWLYFCYGVSRAGNKIINSAAVDFTQHAPANSALQEEAFISIVDGSYNDDAGAGANVITKIVGDVIVSVITSTAGIPVGTIPPGVLGDIVHKLVVDAPPIDPYKVKSLATVGNIRGDDFFWTIRGSERNRYLHFTPMHIALHGAPSDYTPTSAAYISDKEHYESFLALAPCLGPRGYSLFAGDDYNIEWSTRSRLVWPEKRGEENGEVEFSGMDYMLLHNLYCLAYSQDFRKLTVIENTTYNSNINGFQNAVDIIGSNVITAGASCTYTASHSVKLVSGFHAQSGAFFHAQITPAPVDYTGVSQLNQCSNLPVAGRISAAQTPGTTKLARAPELALEKPMPGLEVYPNPTTGMVVIKLLPNPETLSNATVTITSTTGMEVLRQSFSNVGEAIDMSEAPQ